MILKKFSVFCLGLGVQTTALLLSYINKLIEPRPDVTMFVDTGAEPAYVYKNLARLQQMCPWPIYRVYSRDLMRDCINKRMPEKKPCIIYPIIPLFFRNERGRPAMCARTCTTRYKIRVIKKEARRFFGLPHRGSLSFRITFILGISTDEPGRMRDTGAIVYKNKYPLIDELGWSRQDCIDYVRSLGLDNYGRSSCVMCPFKSKLEWYELQQRHWVDFSRAVAFERAMRMKYAGWADVYLSRELVPLDKIDFSIITDYDHFWDNECRGVCGI